MREPADSLQISYLKDALPSVAAQLWQWGNNQRVWAFSGDLGAGKTTLIRELCRSIGVEDSVHSPTFSLINEYVYPGGVIIHMDWYRLQGEDDAVNAGMEDALMREDAICFVEWPEQAAGLLTIPHVWVEIRTMGEEERELAAQQIG